MRSRSDLLLRSTSANLAMATWKGDAPWKIPTTWFSWNDEIWEISRNAGFFCWVIFFSTLQAKLDKLYGTRSTIKHTSWSSETSGTYGLILLIWTFSLQWCYLRSLIGELIFNLRFGRFFGPTNCEEWLFAELESKSRTPTFAFAAIFWMLYKCQKKTKLLD